MAADDFIPFDIGDALAPAPAAAEAPTLDRGARSKHGEGLLPIPGASKDSAIVTPEAPSEVLVRGPGQQHPASGPPLPLTDGSAEAAPSANLRGAATESVTRLKAGHDSSSRQHGEQQRPQKPTANDEITNKSKPSGEQQPRRTRDADYEEGELRPVQAEFSGRQPGPADTTRGGRGAHVRHPNGSSVPTPRAAASPAGSGGLHHGRPGSGHLPYPPRHANPQSPTGPPGSPWLPKRPAATGGPSYIGSPGSRAGLPPRGRSRSPGHRHHQQRPSRSRSSNRFARRTGSRSRSRHSRSPHRRWPAKASTHQRKSWSPGSPRARSRSRSRSYRRSRSRSRRRRGQAAVPLRQGPPTAIQAEAGAPRPKHGDGRGAAARPSSRYEQSDRHGSELAGGGRKGQPDRSAKGASAGKPTRSAAAGAAGLGVGRGGGGGRPGVDGGAAQQADRVVTSDGVVTINRGGGGGAARAAPLVAQQDRPPRAVNAVSTRGRADAPQTFRVILPSGAAEQQREEFEEEELAGQGNQAPKTLSVARSQRQQHPEQQQQQASQQQPRQQKQQLPKQQLAKQQHASPPPQLRLPQQAEPPLPDPSERVWLYRDPAGAVQGPYAAAQFRKWLGALAGRPELEQQHCAFQALTVWRACGQSLALAELLRRG